MSIDFFFFLGDGGGWQNIWRNGILEFIRLSTKIMGNMYYTTTIRFFLLWMTIAHHQTIDCHFTYLLKWEWEKTVREREREREAWDLRQTLHMKWWLTDDWQADCPLQFFGEFECPGTIGPQTQHFRTNRPMGPHY